MAVVRWRILLSGPDFRHRTTSDTPAGNQDIAPTVLSIEGLRIPDSNAGACTRGGDFQEFLYDRLEVGHSLNPSDAPTSYPQTSRGRVPSCGASEQFRRWGARTRMGAWSAIRLGGWILF